MTPYLTLFLSFQENSKRKERRESDCSEGAAKGLVTSQEDRIVGTISARLYWRYFRSGLHGILLMFLLLLFLIAQGRCMYACISLTPFLKFLEPW